MIMIPEVGDKVALKVDPEIRYVVLDTKIIPVAYFVLHDMEVPSSKGRIHLILDGGMEATMNDVEDMVPKID